MLTHVLGCCKSKLLTILNRNFITSFISDFENIYILGTLNNNFVQNCSDLQDSAQISENTNNEQYNIGENNIAEVIGGRLKGKFVSPNVINLSTRIFSKTESVNKALIKEELYVLAENCVFSGTFGMKTPSLYLIHLRRSLLSTVKAMMQLLSFI